LLSEKLPSGQSTFPSRRVVLEGTAIAVRLSIILLVVLASALAARAEPDAVLARFLGRWKTQTSIVHQEKPADEIRTIGIATCQQSLGGRLFEFRSETVPARESELQIMTYDAGEACYRQWVFSSDGYRHEAIGIWNPATATLRWEGRTAAGSFVIHDCWTSENQLDWTLVRSDASGRVVQRIAGRLVRDESR
jgi:hypothetical protein